MNRTAVALVVVVLPIVTACASSGSSSDGTRAASGAGGAGGAKRSSPRKGGSDGGAARASDFGNSDAAVAQTRDAATNVMPHDVVCADQEVRIDRVIPTVILVIDRSGSMDDAFTTGASRWDTLRDFLLQPDGLIASLQGQVNFGLAMYTVQNDGNAHAVGECPLVTSIAPAIDNFDAIAASYRASEPLGDTPTGDSIDKIVGGLNLNDPDRTDPVTLVLATDGEPDTCEQLDPNEGQQEAIDAVTRAFKLGVRTFIISVGNEIGKQHQQDVANAGVGHKPGDPDAPYWVAGDDTTLRAALTEVVGAQLSCAVELNGSVEGGDACLGRVTFNGDDLKCNDKDGWELVDPKHITLKGQACERLKTTTSAEVRVTFPCQVMIVE